MVQGLEHRRPVQVPRGGCGRPTFNAQYEALTIGTGGSITANTLGNKNLRPENTLETEYGIDAELFHKYGVNLTYARDITTDELLLVPASARTNCNEVHGWTCRHQVAP